MIRVALGVLVLLACGAVRADDGGRPNVDVVVPVPPYEHERLHYFGRRDHHLVPGTVTINADPYVCDLDKKHFRDRDHFVDHLRRAHHVEPERIPDRLQVRDGQVHFLND
jgi:hypothetical protein